MTIDFVASTGINVGTAASVDNLFNAGGTLMAWINPDTAGASSLGRIFDKTTFLFNCDNSTATNTFSFEHLRAGTVGRWRMPSSQASYGNWQHVAVTYIGSATANDPVFYYNGATVTVTETSTPTSTISADAANSLYVGNRADAARAFDGRICDARFYNRVLTANEIATIYACKGKDSIASGLIGRWILPGEGAIGATALSSPPDYSGSGNTGTLVGTPAYAASMVVPRRPQKVGLTPRTVSELLGSDLAFWFRADQGLTLNGTDVESWADITGNVTLTPGDANRFTYEATGFNSLPSISCGANPAAFLSGTLSSPILSGSRCWIWLVAQYTALNDSYMLALHSTGDTRWISIGEFTGDWESCHFGTGAASFSAFTSSVSDTNRHLFESGFPVGGTRGLIVSNLASDIPETDAPDANLTTLRLNHMNASITSVPDAEYRVAEIIGSRSIPDANVRALIEGLSETRYGAL